MAWRIMASKSAARCEGSATMSTVPEQGGGDPAQLGHLPIRADAPAVALEDAPGAVQGGAPGPPGARTRRGRRSGEWHDELQADRPGARWPPESRRRWRCRHRPSGRAASRWPVCGRARSAMANPLGGKTGHALRGSRPRRRSGPRRGCARWPRPWPVRASRIFFPVIEPETSTMITSAAAAPATGTWPAPRAPSR